MLFQYGILLAVLAYYFSMKIDFDTTTLGSCLAAVQLCMLYATGSI